MNDQLKNNFWDALTLALFIASFLVELYAKSFIFAVLFFAIIFRVYEKSKTSSDEKFSVKKAKLIVTMCGVFGFLMIALHVFCDLTILATILDVYPALQSVKLTDQFDQKNLFPPIVFFGLAFALKAMFYWVFGSVFRSIQKELV